MKNLFVILVVFILGASLAQANRDTTVSIGEFDAKLDNFLVKLSEFNKFKFAPGIYNGKPTFDDPRCSIKFQRSTSETVIDVVLEGTNLVEFIADKKTDFYSVSSVGTILGPRFFANYIDSNGISVELEIKASATGLSAEVAQTIPPTSPETSAEVKSAYCKTVD